MDQAAAMQGPPVMQSLLQRIKHEPGMRRAQSSNLCAEQPFLAQIDNDAAQREGCYPS
jgi:hypothetical protein